MTLNIELREELEKKSNLEENIASSPKFFQVNLGAEVRIEVMVKDILPNIKYRTGASQYFLKGLFQKGYELIPKTADPIKYTIILWESYVWFFEIDIKYKDLLKFFERENLKQIENRG